MMGIEQSSDAIWTHYLNRVGGREMYRKDPHFRAQMDLVREFMRHLGIVLEEELQRHALGQLLVGAFPVETLIERVLRGFLYGASPGVSDAQQRIAMHEQMVDLLERQATPQRFIPPWGTTPQKPEEGDDSGR